MVEGYKRGIWFIGKESPSLLCRQPHLGKGAFEKFGIQIIQSLYKGEICQILLENEIKYDDVLTCKNLCI